MTRPLKYCFISTVLWSANLAAQSDAPAPLKIGDVTVSGFFHERYEDWNFFRGAKGENDYGYSGSFLRLMFSEKTRKLDWAVEFAAPILLGIPNQAVQPAPLGQLGLGAAYYAANHNNSAAASIFLKQGYVRVKGTHSNLKLGRFEFFDGGELTPKDETLAIVKRDGVSQRLIGTFGFADVQRSVDGAVYTWADRDWNFTAFSGVPDRGVFQVDGWGWVVTPVTYAALNKDANWGRTKAEWRIFGIFYNDDRGVIKVDNRSTAAKNGDHAGIDVGTYGGNLMEAIPTTAGTFDLMGWGVLQNGKWGSLTQKSGAGTVEAGYQPAILKPVRPWIRGGYFYSSGDGNANDSTHGTFFAILPTPRVYARFPFFNEMNNVDTFGELMLRPAKGMAIRSDIHGLWLANSTDLWYAGGGAFQPWTFGFNGRPANGQTGLATLYDVSWDYQVSRGLGVGLYFGYARGGEVVRKIFPQDPNAKMGFLEVNYRM
ncbi:MAG TPA: alginate export family protein [Bryobacteraceae bacterium]|nr:alginate export family protein [Bryobacteraceae bacterium]